MRNKITKFFQSTAGQKFLASFWRTLFLLILADFILWWFVAPIFLILLFGVVLLGFIFYYFEFFGLLLMTLFFPFLNWQWQYGSFNVPLADLCGLFLFFVFLTKAINGLICGKFSFKKFVSKYLPTFFFFLLWASAGILAMNHNNDVAEALKFYLRPLLFFYLIFVLLPYNIIKNKTDLRKVLLVMLGACLLTAVIGLSGSLLNQDSGLQGFRAQPISWFGFNPLSGNHNAVAEIMVIGMPVALALFVLEKKVRFRSWYVLAMIFMLVILLMTFSRSGFLALLFELLVLAVIFQRKKINFKRVFVYLLFGLIIFGGAYVYCLQNYSFVEVSNANRLLLSGISWHSFLQHPFVGNGLNSFQSIVGSTFIYIVDFGEPLDSHGFVQKILTEMGLLGLLGFVGILSGIGYPFYRFLTFRKKGEDYAVIACLFVVMVGIVVFELFSTSYYTGIMWLPIGVGLAGVKVFQDYETTTTVMKNK
ncbi:MAG: O-antigen ligase family protein [Patescibacteria group bacterium]